MNLSWKGKGDKNLEFPEHYWKYLINTFGQFSAGEHYVTKAFQDKEDYLGLTDDYDFCWGPEVEGRPLKDDEFYYTERLWGVYTRTAGEIYLLKANEDMTGWEMEERLTFVPSGSQKARIVFDKNGHYVIVVEIITDNGKPEIWIMEYPYEGSAIRKLFDGNNPCIFKDFYRNIYVFYQLNDNRYQINYRSSTDGYSVDYVIELTKSESVVDPRKIFKFINDQGLGYILAFYLRDDDIRPIKYAIAGPYYFPLEEFSVGGRLQDISWKHDPIIGIGENFNVGGRLQSIYWKPSIRIDIGENFNVGGRLQSIYWEPVTIIGIGENFNVGGRLQSISWEYLGIPRIGIGENFNVDGSLQGISWEYVGP